MFPKRDSFSLFTLLVGDGPHIEMMQWLERLVLDKEIVTLEPVSKCLGELVLGVRISRNNGGKGKR